MASANRYPGIDPRIVRCVRHHAGRIRAALPGMEIEDVEQELMLHVHRRLSRFRCGSWLAPHLRRQGRQELRRQPAAVGAVGTARFGVEVLSRYARPSCRWRRYRCRRRRRGARLRASRRLCAGRPAEPARRALAHLRSAAIGSAQLLSRTFSTTRWRMQRVEPAYRGARCTHGSAAIRKAFRPPTFSSTWPSPTLSRCFR